MKPWSQFARRVFGARPPQSFHPKRAFGTDVAQELIITAAAARRLSEVKAASVSNPAVDRLALRVRVDSGGCSGFKYAFELDFSGPSDDDVVFEKGDARVVVDRASLPLISGATLNWSQDMMRQAFAIINNPQSDSGCSCGASFTPK
jgi:iron-sulfur cluster assembly accessory protein